MASPTVVPFMVRALAAVSGFRLKRVDIGGFVLCRLGLVGLLKLHNWYNGL